jgi:pyruvate dehydrogenase E1 component
VVTLKWGKAQARAFARPGGAALKAWIEACPNADYAALTYQGGAAWRQRLTADIGARPGVRALLESFDDAGLHELMIGLGGHCMETLVEAFAQAAKDDTPTMFIAYTIKGFGLPLQGHKDNHAGLMTPTQVDALRETMGVPAGEEWAPFAGLSAEAAKDLRAFIDDQPFAAKVERQHKARPIPVPSRAEFPCPEGREQATQAAFGKILLELAKGDGELADRIVTTSPDVTVSTNLGGFVNQRGLFRRQESRDVFRDAKIPSPQKWAGGGAGQHIELGIAEHNLFLNLGALGLSAPLWGERLIPIGTVYDPFISRGLDALNYACYQDARFMLVATPSGLTLGPEGGAHQSIYTPLIGIGQPGLTYFEPAFVDEPAEVMRWSFEHMQADDGGSVYLRLTTRALQQVERNDDAWREDALKGAYWLKAPGEGADAAIAFCGAVAPEVLEAAQALAEDIPGLGVLNVVSPGLLHRDWMAARRGRWTGEGRRDSHAEGLLGRLAPGAGLVTVVDGSPATLSWLGGVRGMRVSSLGLDSFGQVGDLPDLYRHYRLDVDAIVEACADLFLGAA